MRELISTPIFGIMISLIAFEIGCILYKKTKVPILNPLFTSIIMVMCFLTIFNINVSDYDKGGQFISFFLSPATVILAVPLYKKIKLLKAYALPIVAGITAGSLVGIITVIFLCHLFGISKPLDISMIPKSITVPIGVEVSKQLGGIPSITVAAIIITGIMGAVVGPYVCKLFKIEDKVAVGVAIGTASHAVGTTKAIELGEVEGAMSSLSIGLAGIITVFIAPVITKIFENFI
ncbi:LrgB family protein [Clostridium sp. A1-XYC3]|uniref:LrgB family protein n=1 Tax=Clostridium tanneri TaxID=3037988 RepID=A0ABU4JUX7_9CLOT|nr:LrgB family protein [Clostridium sp. A1-XYC3]MDW8801956.1 LrgB family protein [Clostridium sp. A1-XYC3]